MQTKYDKKADLKYLSQQLKKLLFQSPFHYSGFLLAVLVFIGSTVYIAFIHKQLVTVVAFFIFLPLLVIEIDNIRDKLSNRAPRWPVWLLIINYSVFFIGFAPIVIWNRFPPEIYTAAVLVSTLAIFATLLPRLLNILSTLLAAVPYLGTHIQKVFSPSNIYIIYLFLVGATPVLTPFFRTFSEDSWLAPIQRYYTYSTAAYDVTVLKIHGALILSLLPALIWRKLLWSKNNDRIFISLLPHLSVWLLTVLFFISLLQAHLRFENYIYEYYNAIFVLSPLAIIYWTLQTLRGDTVKPFEKSLSTRSDSIQSNVSDFIDVHGYSAHLISSINRSDAGVYGVTGVRGAGKSALTRHVLAQLKEHYFVLEITAPARFDPNLSFIISVIRSICRKVLSDLEQILFGKESGDIIQLKRRFRNVTLIILLISAGVSSIWPLLPTVEINEKTGDYIFKYNDINLTSFPVFGKDPLLGGRTSLLTSHFIVATERRIIDSLISQMNIILSEQQSKQAVNFLLLPVSDGQGFFLALDYKPFEEEQYLGLNHSLHRKTFHQPEGTEWLNPYVFWEINAQLNEFICSSKTYYPEHSHWITGEIYSGGYRYINDFTISGTENDNQSLSCKVNKIKMYNDDIDEGLKFILEKLPYFKGPLALLNREIRFLLIANSDGKKSILNTQNKKSQTNNSLCNIPKSNNDNNSERQLISSLILEAFCHPETRLSFDLERLEQFRQLLKIYQRLLNGEINTGPVSFSPDSKNQFFPRPNFQNIFSLVFWSAITLILLILIARPVWRGFVTLSSAVVNRRYLNLYHEAGQFVELLSYTSTQQDSRSFGFKGISLGQSSTRAARDLTLSGLTARYLEFIKLICEQYNGKVIIVIDELDKIHEPDQVKALLTEIKGALFSKGCFYLMSISEDAARSFRYRLTSGRDIFESTFDEILEIKQMDVQAGSAMLSKREENLEVSNKLPQECLALLILFGGGIPREVIREARNLSLQMNDTDEQPYSWAARLLLQEEILNWISHFGETNLNGGDTIRLRDCAQLALRPFNNFTIATKLDYSEVILHLQSCLNIIDPDELRKSEGYVTNTLHSKESHTSLSNIQQSRYQELVSDIQACLRLLILTTIAELTEKTQNNWKQYDKAIFSCHFALGDKPALAEALLKELRSKHQLENNLDNTEDQARKNL